MNYLIVHQVLLLLEVVIVHISVLLQELEINLEVMLLLLLLDLHSKQSQLHLVLTKVIPKLVVIWVLLSLHQQLIIGLLLLKLKLELLNTQVYHI